jgi:hypothetical protein
MRTDTRYSNSGIFSKMMLFMVLLVIGVFVAVVSAMPDLPGSLMSDFWKLLSNLATFKN